MAFLVGMAFVVSCIAVAGLVAWAVETGGADFETDVK